MADVIKIDGAPRKETPPPAREPGHRAPIAVLARQAFGQPRHAAAWPKTGAQLREAGYRPHDGKMARCVHCKEPIYFARTPKGNLMPLEWVGFRYPAGDPRQLWQHHRSTCAYFARHRAMDNQPGLFENEPDDL